MSDAGHAQPEPTLFSEPIHGLRAWRVLADGRLTGIAKHQAWPTDGPLESECLRFCHYSPAPDCSCGAYGFHPNPFRLRMLSRRHGPQRAGFVFGVVQAWGRMEVHLDGFRAQWARPRALVTLSADRRSPYRLKKRAAARYGAELIHARSTEEAWELIDQRGLRGLSRAQADDLVVDGAEIVLIPRTTSYLSDRDRPMASSGFRSHWSIRGHRAELAEERRRRLPGIQVVELQTGPEFESALQSESFLPGRAVRLGLDGRNLGDRRAVAVLDEAESTQVGWLVGPRGRRVRSLMLRDAVKESRVFWQERCLTTGRRTGLTILVSRCPVRLATDSERDPDSDIPF